MLVTERYHLPKEVREDLRARPVPWGFGAFSEAIFYRTYSRMKEDGQPEQWADTVIRVVEGTMSIRKDWYKKMGLPWKEDHWAMTARRMAEFIHAMKFLPPGRGLWAMGTDYIFQRGSAALNNCGLVDVRYSLADAAMWAMDQLMCGVGVGFTTDNATLRTLRSIDIQQPGWGSTTYAHYPSIPDSREGWVQSVGRVIRTYEESLAHPIMDYSLIRPLGSPIRGFGGVASGPAPLKELHERLNSYLQRSAEGNLSHTRLIVDTMNAIGACVIAGNVRRSAQIASGDIGDMEFLNLKNYDKNPDRKEIGWASNNSVVLKESGEFELLPVIAERILDNGEPGIINLINVQKYGRVGKKKPDLAVGTNPCGEIPLEDRELCNLVEIFPTRCRDHWEIWEAMRLATIYASTVSLLPSHDESTNRVVARNRRIGVSVSGIADWLDARSLSEVTMVLREGYEKYVEPTNREMAADAGVPASVRLTTVKPSGTISLLAGVSPGMHWPIYRYFLRRVRVSENSPVAERLLAAQIPSVKDTDSANTLVFEFPLQSGSGKTRSVSEVSIWEQASLLTMLQREWADNAVSNTLTFSPKEEGNQIERVLAANAPLIKSMSLLPNQGEQPSYSLLPYEKISKEEFQKRAANMQKIDWQSLSGSDGMDSRYCDTNECEI